MTHGCREPVVRWLREHGLQAQAVASRWEGEGDADDVLVVVESDGPGDVPPVDHTGARRMSQVGHS